MLPVPLEVGEYVLIEMENPIQRAKVRVPIRELEPSLYSSLDRDDEGAPYDTRAAGYDWLVSMRGYSRVAWGVPPATHTRSCDGRRRRLHCLDTREGTG